MSYKLKDKQKNITERPGSHFHWTQTFLMALHPQMWTRHEREDGFVEDRKVTENCQSRQTDSAFPHSEKGLWWLCNPSWRFPLTPRPAVTTVLAQKKRRNAWQNLLENSRICVCEFFTLEELLPLEGRQFHPLSPGSFQMSWEWGRQPWCARAGAD